MPSAPLRWDAPSRRPRHTDSMVRRLNRPHFLEVPFIYGFAKSDDFAHRPDRRYKLGPEPDGPPPSTAVAVAHSSQVRMSSPMIVERAIREEILLRGERVITRMQSILRCALLSRCKIRAWNLCQSTKCRTPSRAEPPCERRRISVDTGWPCLRADYYFKFSFWTYFDCCLL
jgi:hypothetical protein